jgi:hypothetical protein
MAAVLTSAPRIDLSKVSFAGRFVRELTPDPVAANARRQVPGASYSRVAPTPVAAPTLLAWSEPLAAALGLARPSAAALEALAGHRVFPGMEPFAARYGGHQFGPRCRPSGNRCSRATGRRR